MRWLFAVAPAAIILAGGAVYHEFHGWATLPVPHVSEASAREPAGGLANRPADAATRPSAAPALPGTDAAQAAMMSTDGECRDRIQADYPDFKGMASISGVHGGRHRIDYLRPATGEVWSFVCDGRRGAVRIEQVDGLRTGADTVGWDQQPDGSLTFYDNGRKGPSFSANAAGGVDASY